MQTIGERLEEARKRKGISIREAAEATKIRGDYLQRFENNQFDLNLADIYVRGFLRGYASFLKLPVEKILNDFNALGTGSRAPKTPNREIYGRMDLSVASSDDDESDREKQAAPQQKQQQAPRRTKPPFGKPGSGMPPGPAIDPNLVIKGGIVLVGVIIALLVIWGLVSVFSGGPEETAATAPAGSAPEAPSAPAVQPDYVLVALDTVAVTVRRGDASKVSVAELGPTAWSGQLEKGRTQRLPSPGPYTVLVTPEGAGNKIAVDYAGRRVASGQFGDVFVLP